MTDRLAIVVAGASRHGKVVAEIVEKEARYRIAGFIDSVRPSGQEWYGYRILGSEEDLPALVAQHAIHGFVVAVGDNWARQAFTARICELAPGLNEVGAIHPSAQLGRGVEVGVGTVIMAGAVVNADCRIGRGCIVNTRASLDHDGILQDWASLAPGATLGGDVTVGAFTAVSIGATVVHGRRIGAHTVVGAGATVLQDLPDHVVAYGVPARVVRSRQEGERYL